MEIKKYTGQVMAMLTKYREKNNDRLSKIERITVSKLNRDIERLIDITVAQTLKAARVNSSLEVNDIRESEKFKRSLVTIRQGVTEPYGLARDVALSLSDEREQTAKAHLYEQFRLVLFRMLSGIGIAIIVLCASWVAHKLEIPLPFRFGV